MYNNQQSLTEYKRYLRQLRSTTRLQLSLLPIIQPIEDSPDFRCKGKIQGITDEYYKQLNGEIVFVYRKQRIKHRVYFNSGQVRDTKITQVPSDCVPILSDKVLGLPHKYEPQDIRLNYLDFIVDAQNPKHKYRNYIYCVPKENIIPVKQTCLIVTSLPRTSHYGGYKLTLTNGHPIYLLIVDYKYSLTQDRNIRVILGGRGLISLSTVEDYIEYLAQLKIAHSLDSYDGLFCREIDPRKDFVESTLTLDKTLDNSVEDITNSYLADLD